MNRVLDVGAGSNPDPRATETADIDAAHDPDHVFDITEAWPFDAETFDTVIANHVIEHVADPGPVCGEASRVLKHGGAFEVTVPIGVNAHADPDHERVFEWPTFEILSGEYDGGREWDPDNDLVLWNREVTPEFDNPLDRLVYRTRWVSDRWAMHNAELGEATAVYKKLKRGRDR